MSASAARVVLRHPAFRRVAVRHASSTSEAASSAAATAKETASQATSKASQGLTRVTSTASGAMSKAGPAITGAIGRIGGPAGRLISFVSSLYPPAIYYSKVAAELSKNIFHSQKMYPPTTAQFQQYFQPLINMIRNPSTISINPQAYLQQLRSLSTAQLTSIGIIGAELIGFFTIGEIIGKLKIVGYRGQPAHAEH